MMQALTELLAIVMILLNFRLLGGSRLKACIQALAIQALVLNILPVLANFSRDPWVITLVIGSTLIKAVLLPALLMQAINKTGVTNEVKPIIGYTRSLLIGAAMLALCALASRALKVPFSDAEQLLVPVSLFTILTGAFLLVARRKAINQVLGFLVLENGVYLFGVTFAVSEPWLVQMGVLLDVLAAVFIMGIIIYHINREFGDIDIDRLSNLKD
ncbi:MAG TPA: NADH-quinone oxidoreductase subunit K [Myxococcota bacterium]|nr:NADH-quinone oxidoreductase subunit K [Myxococcota bacterium]HOA14608.1 NADH-quinone oxidoreductase subunit K [Myxococcota bacterium]HOC99938.1 NADH-quinone oxidoreductase subunit K [Myxococcota bacterium]HOH77957.1 NADH-quinone oxidoreductase subunit K [Myxococcota bacterium]HPV05328.1 NADH-quinone oxidoreductase subunit K [Myxococcota bacterium]